MSAEIIDLKGRQRERDNGNGAREALIEIGRNCPFHEPHDVAINWAEDVLMELWARGFRVVPIEKQEAP
jgi:hypothetical protein